MWVDDGERRNYANVAAQAFSTVSKFSKHKPNRPVALGVGICWIRPPVTQTVDAFYNADFHVNLVLLIPSSVGNRPRTIVVCDPNVRGRKAGGMRMREALFPRMCTLLETTELKGLPRWCNEPREVRNTKGICLALALEWAVELVANGVAALEIEREGGDITSIKGFRKLMK